MHNIAVIDIGGTAIKYGLMTPEGTLKQQGSMPTKAREDGADGIVEKVIGIVKEYQQHFYVDAVGIDTAGIVKPGQDGEIVFAGGESFPGYSGTRLGKLVREATGLPCVVENDVNAAAIGEYTQGAARGAKSAFVMTVGTGIGGCLILDGKIWHGASYSAGEAGFMRVHGDQRIFEEIASTRAMLQEAAYTHNVSPAELTGEQVFAWARRGDAPQPGNHRPRRRHHGSTPDARSAHHPRSRTPRSRGHAEKHQDRLRPARQYRRHDRRGTVGTAVANFS